MSTDYTKNDTNIYFLNDRNIATTLNDVIDKNAIPSNELFKEKYNELTGTDNEISGKLESLSGFANTISSDFDTKTEKALADAKTYTNEVSGGISVIIDSNRTSDKSELSNVLSSYTNKQVSNLSTSLSNTVEAKFVNVSGDTITGELKVNKVLATELSSGDTNISGNVSISGKKVIIGNSSAKYDNMFVWNADEGNYEGKTVDPNTGRTFNINPSHGSRGFFIGNQSLSDIISNDTQLTATDIRKEIDVVSSLMIEKYALSDDVKSEIDRIDNTGYLISSDFDFEYKDQTIWLSAGNKVVSIDAGDFIKDGMLLSATLVQQKEDTGEFGQFLKFIFNTDSETTPIYVDLQKLVDIYEGQNGIVVTPIDNKFIITPNHEIIAKTSDVNKISGNLSQLSSSVKEISGDHEDRINKNTSHLNIIQTYVNGLSGVDGTIETIKKEASNLKNDVTSIDARLTTTENITNISKNNIDTLSSKVDVYIAETNKDIESLKESKNKLDSDVNALKLFDEKLIQEGGYIDIINNNISVLQREIANNATFGEHIVIGQDDINRTLAEIFDTHGLINPGSNPKTLKNGNIYRVEMLSILNDKDVSLSDKVTASFTTKDGFKFVHDDYIVIHSHDKDYVELTDLISCVEVIPSVRFDDFNKLSARADTNYFWLNGNNNQEATWIGEDGLVKENHSIGGNNYFKDTNYFENISVQNISAIDAKINDISATDTTTEKLSAIDAKINMISATNAIIEDISATGILAKIAKINNISSTYAIINDISVVNGLSGDWSKIVDSNTKFSLFDLCTAVSSKIFIDNKVDEDCTNGTSDLSIIKLSKDEYNNIICSNNPLKDDVLYIVYSDYIDAYGQVMKNLTMSDLSGKEASEAVNKSYFENVVSDISNYLSDEISLSANNLCVALSDENEQVTILTNNLKSNYIEKIIIKSAISSLTLESQLSDVITALSILNDSL